MKILTIDGDKAKCSGCGQMAVKNESGEYDDICEACGEKLKMVYLQSDATTINLDNRIDNKKTQYKPMSVGDWILTFLIMVIPIVNIVMLFVWGFGNNTHPSKASWAKAALILIAISFVLYFVFFGAMYYRGETL